ncbi:7-deoxyloganetin glucosyltransferase-like [Zingiber officinale]|uniref:7-deoxyloganetin glucosyltransferase-like n=1 Tax=Zingiber officinale TaxID=94328 RepID=UPI001C4DAEBD|nr:7-deoxyloganetin glucosyltransferase-like [Zingiber officinale]
MASLTATEPQPLSILVPIPPQGHITPFLRLATLLLSRGFRVTFVLTEYNARHLAQSRGHDWATAGGPSFRVETIPDDLPPPPSDKQDVTQDILSVYLSVRSTCLAPSGTSWLASIPVLENLRLRDFPTFVRTTNPDDVMLNLIVCRATINAPRCAGLILNTFAALEGPVLDTIRSKYPNLYAIGPLPSSPVSSSL